MQLDDTHVDIAKYFGRAYDNYSKIPGKHHRMLATRSMLWCAVLQRATGQFFGASQSLLKAHFEVELWPSGNILCVYSP